MAFMRNKNFLKHVGQNHAVAAGRVTLAGSGTAATIVEGSEWIASATHTGGSNNLVITLKDTMAKIIVAIGESFTTPGGSAPGATSDYVQTTTITNEGTASAPVVTFLTLQAGGAARNDQTGDVSIVLYCRETNVSTPGGN